MFLIFGVQILPIGLTRRSFMEIVYLQSRYRPINCVFHISPYTRDPGRLQSHLM